LKQLVPLFVEQCTCLSTSSNQMLDLYPEFICNKLGQESAYRRLWKSLSSSSWLSRLRIKTKVALIVEKVNVDIKLLEGDLIYQKGALPEPVGCSYVQKSVCDWLGLQSTLGLLSHTPDRSLYHISKLSLSVLVSPQFIAMVQRQDWNGMDCNKDIRCC